MTDTWQCRHVYLFVLKEIKSHINVLSGLMMSAKIQKNWNYKLSLLFRGWSNAIIYVSVVWRNRHQWHKQGHHDT